MQQHRKMFGNSCSFLHKMEVLVKLFLILMIVMMPLVLGQAEQEPSPNLPRPAYQCNCPIRHPQEKICRAHIVIQGRIMGLKSPGDGLPLAGGMLEFSVKVTKIYKDKYNVLARGKRIAMITSNSIGKCGVTEMESGALYLLTGLVIEDEVFFSQCEWVQRFKDLTPDQKEGLTTAYLTGCDACLIDQQGNSIPGIHAISSSSNVCFHDPLGSDALQVEDCESEYSICKPVNGDQCAWMPGQRYDKCVDKRSNKFNEAKQTALRQKSSARGM